MADIVERLREGHCAAGCNSAKVCLCAEMEDAAAEITALRARVAESEIEAEARVAQWLRREADEQWGLAAKWLERGSMKFAKEHDMRAAALKEAADAIELREHLEPDHG